MNSDIRIAISFKGHRKRRRLRRLIGDRSDSYLIDLWITVALDCPTGHLVGWDEIDVADSCGWEGDPKEIVGAFIDSGWLEKDVNGEYAMHDWCEHQSWACGADARSMRAKKAAAARWGTCDDENAEKQKLESGKTDNSKGECTEHAQCNPPILSLPSPIPSLPKENTPPNPQGGNDRFDEFWDLYGKKKDKKKCEPKWKKIKQEDRDIILKTLPAYIASTPDIQFRKNPTTYLTGECWNDEITNEGNSKNGKNQNYTGHDDREPVIENCFPEWD